MDLEPAAKLALPEDAGDALLVGRVWRPDVRGPAVVAIRDGAVIDISSSAATVSQLCDSDDPAALARDAPGESLGSLDALLANSPRPRPDPTRPWLLSPADLQAVKAAGVTFAASMLERVIEEQARGQTDRAAAIRADMAQAIGADLSTLKPGSEQAATLKAILIQRGLWSQYLEVGIGPDAEIFTKAQPLSSVGHLADVGIHPGSTWNNPEPEIVLFVSSQGRIVGATLGNDVNLRDFEGRSALLLGKAKDNTSSAAIGPFLRLFDGTYGLDEVRNAKLSMLVEGDDGFTLDGSSEMSRISRDPEDLARQTLNGNHQYPDGFVLYLGTMFAPIKDRDHPGQGFTHKPGDRVSIASPRLGRLSNRVLLCPDAEPWSFGTGSLMRNLAERKLL